MEQLNTLLAKFRAGHLTLAELKTLDELLLAHEQELGSEIDGEFYQVQQEIASLLTPERSKELLQSIHSKMEIKTPDPKVFSIKKQLIKIAVAASLVGTILIAGFLLAKNIESGQGTVASNTNQKLNTLRVFVNTSDTNHMVRLEDGSIVELTPKSGIAYYQPFVNNRRDISLKGDAFFKVAKDAQRPFTVHAGGLATTAIGTQFWVYANDASQTDVNLIEGKVMVRRVSGDAIPTEDIYLVAGQSLSLDMITSKIVVEKQAGKNLDTSKPTINMAIRGKESKIQNLVFDNATIETVISTIEKRYKYQVVYNKADVTGITFTGTFLQSDSLKLVLSSICIMNGLTFEILEDKVNISKRN